MASGWVLKGSIIRSAKVRRLYKEGPLDPIRVYCILRATCDNWGMMPADKWTLKAELGPEDPHHTPADFEAVVKTLASVELVQLWEDQNSPWLYVVGHEEANGTYLKKRKGKPRVARPEVIMLEDASTLVPTRNHDASTLGDMEGDREEGRGKREGEPEITPSISPPPKTSTPRIGDCLPKSLGPDARPTSDQHLEIQELLEEIRATRGEDVPPPPPADDTRNRVIDALKHFHLTGCKKAIRGHWKECNKDGSRFGKGYWSWCPPADKGGRRASNKVNQERVVDFMSSDRARPVGAAKPHVAPEEIPKEEALATGLKGIAAAKAAIKEV